MHSKKFLAAFLALSITAAPQASVMASAENASAQESSEDSSGESDENTAQETEETDAGETEQNTDDVSSGEEFLQITDKKAYAEDDSILIEIVSANTTYNRVYIGNRTDEDRTPVMKRADIIICFISTRSTLVKKRLMSREIQRMTAGIQRKNCILCFRLKYQKHLYRKQRIQQNLLKQYRQQKKILLQIIPAKE